MSTRGEHLVRADRRFATGGGALAKLAGPAFSRVLDQIDRRLPAGGLDVTLPGGGRRRLGFRAPGPRANVRLATWMALVRLATSGSVGWYKAWALGEWSSRSPIWSSTTAKLRANRRPITPLPLTNNSPPRSR